ncbi:hypothetical protein MCHI_000913 [Candidatus Magnetoovum chiemensis]|nr:hypothetical protein MCHI_000913 [Candidatus Magnetoovum chiemensis]
MISGDNAQDNVSGSGYQDDDIKNEVSGNMADDCSSGQNVYSGISADYSISGGNQDEKSNVENS